MAMTNEEIISDFDSLFGDNSEEDIEENPTEEEEIEEEEESEEEEDEEEDSEEDSEDEESDEEDEEEEDSEEDKKKARQNYAFAQQRQQIRAQEQFIKNLGKLIGMDNAKPEEIQNKVQEVLLEKQSKEQNIPVEILQRLEAAEAIVQENQAIRRQTEVQDSLAELAEKHDLDSDEIMEFTQYLIDNDKNPLDHPEIDLAAEYLKIHYEDMVQAAVDKALGKEKERQKKVEDKGASPAPDGNGGPDEDGKIDTIEDLDKLFSSMDL